MICYIVLYLCQEFYEPLQTSGLLSTEHMEAVFSNLLELISISQQFVEQLNQTLSIASQQGDQVQTEVPSK